MERGRGALFGLGYIMVKDVPVETRSFILLMLLDFAQMAAFPLSGNPKFPWKGTPVEPVSMLLNYITTDTIDQTHGVDAFRAVLIIAASWTGLFLALAAHVAKVFLDEGPQFEFELRVLRSVALLSTTTLFLPFTSVLFRALACPGGEEWFESGWGCESGSRVAVAIVLGVMLVSFAGLSLFVAAVFVDRNPASLSWSARSHGRVDVILLVQKLVLAFLFNVVDEELMGSGVLAAILVISGLVWFGLVARKMPLTNMEVNSFQAGLALGYTWLCFTTALAKIFPAYDFFLLVYVGAPMAVVVGYFFARLQATTLIDRPLEDLRSVDEINAWARFRMQQWATLSKGLERMRKHQNDDDGFGETGEDDAPPPPPVVPGLARLTSKASMRPKGGAASVAHGAGGGASVAPGMNAASAAAAAQAAKAAAPKGAAQAAHAVPVDPLEAARAVAREEAERGYRFLMDLGSESDLALVECAAFFENASPFFFEEATALAKARRLQPSLDTRFVVYRRSRQLRESDGSGLSPIDRIIFDQKLREVAQLRVDAYRSLVLFWENLSEACPDLEALSSCGEGLNSSLTRIEALYADLMNINPESTTVLRGYAGYLLELRNENTKAQELLNKADRIEAVHERSSSNGLKHIVFGKSQPRKGTIDENSAVVTISGFQQGLGEVIKVSTAAVRTFGYSSRAHMVGQNVNTLIPSPIREVHDRLLLGFAGKQSSTVVGKTRLLAGVRRDGSIFPLWITIMEAPPDAETCEPQFTAHINEITTDEEMVIFGGMRDGYRMYGCTEGAARHLGVDPEVVRQDRPSMLSWFPSLAPTYEPEDVVFDEGQLAWLRRRVARGDITGELARLVGGARGGAGGKGAKAGLAGRGGMGAGGRMLRGRGGAKHISSPVPPLLSLTTRPGLMYVADASTAAGDVASWDSGSVGSGGGGGKKEKDSMLEEAPLAVGQVQHIGIPNVERFTVLTFRMIESEGHHGHGHGHGHSAHGAGAAAASSPAHKVGPPPPAMKATGGAVALLSEIAEGGSLVEAGSREVESSGFPESSDARAAPSSSAASASGSSSGSEASDDDGEDDDDDDEERKVSSSAAPESRDSASAPSRHAPPPIPPAGPPMGVSRARQGMPDADVAAAGAIVKPTQGPRRGSVKVKMEGSSKPEHSLLDDSDTPTGLFDAVPTGDGSFAGGSMNGSVDFEGGAKGGRRGSVGGGAGSVGSSGSNSVKQLQRALTSSAGSMEPEIRSVRWIFFWLLIAIIFLAVAVEVWMGIVVQHIDEQGLGIALAGKRAIDISQAAKAVNTMLYLSEGLDPATVDNTIAGRSAAALDRAAEATLQSEQLALLGTTAGQGAYDYELNERFTLLDPNTGRTGSFNLLSLSKTVVTLISRAAKREGNVTFSDPSVKLYQAYLNPVFARLTYSNELRHIDLLHLIESISIQYLSTGSAFFLLTVVVATIALISAVRSLFWRSNEILQTFLLVPRNVAQAMKGKASSLLDKVLESSHALEEDADDNMSEKDDEDAGEEDMDQQERLVEEMRREEVYEAALRQARRGPIIGRRGSAITPSGTSVSGGGALRSEEGGSEIFLDDAKRDAKRRPYSDTSRFVVQNVMKLLFPVIFVFLFIAAVIVWFNQTITEVSNNLHRLVAIQRSGTSLAFYEMELQRSLLSANATVRDNAVERGTDFGDRFIESLEVSLHGGSITSVGQEIPIIPMTSESGIMYELFETDVCLADAQPSGDLDECKSLGEGILRTGLVSAGRGLVQVGERILYAVNNNKERVNASDNSFPPELKASINADFLLASKLEDPYLTNGLNHAADVELATVVSTNSAFRGGISALSGISVAGFLLVSIFLFIPVSARLSHRLYSARGLLTLLPGDLLVAIPQLRGELRALAARAQIDSRASGSSRGCCR